MSKKRKVNAPASARRQRTHAKTPMGRHPLESRGTTRNAGQFFGIAFVLLALGALIVTLTMFLPKWLPRKPMPWEDFKERMVEDAERSLATGRQTFVLARLSGNRPEDREVKARLEAAMAPVPAEES